MTDAASLPQRKRKRTTPKLRHANCLEPQPRWMLTLKVGHVIAKPHGPYRIVRDVSRYGNGDLRSVTLAIRRCSWTHRCYTILNYTDLRIFGYRRVRVKPRTLHGTMDRKIIAAMHQPAFEPFILTCCDVEGTP